MAEQQLSIRSTEARNLARKLAKREKRTLTQVVLQALQDRAQLLNKPKQETDAAFWERMHKEYATDIDLQSLIDVNRKSHTPIDL
jgi:hypothetical protein